MEKERIYMSLLERRIAELEALLSKSDENTFPPDESIASPTVEKRIDVPNGEKESGADKSSANGIGVEVSSLATVFGTSIIIQQS